MHPHAWKTLRKTIYFTTVSATAQLLCLDWMQLKLLPDSPLVKLPLTKGWPDWENKVSWFNWLHKFNEEHSWQQHVCIDWEQKHLWAVAFDYSGKESAPSSDYFSTQRFPQSNSRLTSFTPSRDLSEHENGERNQYAEWGRELKIKKHWVAGGGSEECMGSKRVMQVCNYAVIIAIPDSEAAKSLICPR